MNQILTKAITTARTLWNKGLIILALGILMGSYLALNSKESSPFAELLYALILIAGVFALAPVFRLLFFPEVAEYAESGKLREDLAQDNASEMLRHYRFATIVCFAVPSAVIPFLL